MKTFAPAVSILAALVWASLPPAFADDRMCRGAERLAAPVDAPERFKYAPSREVDILHLELDVIPDFRRRTVSGQATLRFKPIARPLPELRLDGVDLVVTNVTATEKLAGHQATREQVIVTFAEPAPAGKEVTVVIRYHAAPRKGLYFRTPELGYPAEDMHLYTQGQSIEARHWYPCFDAPNEKFTSAVTCRVPAGMVVLSNGRRVSDEPDPTTGLVAVRWLQDKPHVNYLISLLAGRLKALEDTYRGLPLAFYTPASQLAHARSSFEGTKDMLAFFEQEIGVPYPWDKYYQVCVTDFGGGMENTSITTLDDSTLHPADFEPLRSSEGLVAHELVHQWFGDLVTCKDWANLWLNEGFATYYEQLYARHRHGQDAFLYGLLESARHIVSQPDQTNAIVRRDYGSPDEMFGYLTYPKGAWVLHMLRSQLGEDLFRRCIKTWLERHQLGNVITEDLNTVVEELSGRSFDPFFDQWVYHASQPDLAVSYSWDERAKLARVSIAQNQRLSERVLLFQFPLTLRFKSKSGVVDRQVTVKARAEDFYFALPEAPEVVRIDPELTLLARVSFSPPIAMLHAMLADQTDMLGRLLAVEQLSGRREALDKLKHALNTDPFYGVRIAASKSIRALASDEALEALLASTRQADARARQQVLADIGGFYREAAFTALMRLLPEERHPDLQARILRALGAWHKPEARDLVLRHLRSDSFRQVLAEAAMNAMRAQDDPVYLAPLQEQLQTRESVFPTGVLARGLENLAWLARNETNKDAVREFLTARVSHPRPAVRRAAISALGTLGDAKAIAVLEKLAEGAPEGPERGSAERALSRLRDARPPSVELGSLRSDVLTLQRENRELRRDLDELRRRFDAVTAKLAPATPAPTTKPAPRLKPPKG